MNVKPYSYRFMIILLLILVLGAYLRVDFVRSVKHSMPPDARNYTAMAIQIVDKGVYGYNSETPNAYVAPGYPLFVALTYKMSSMMGVDHLALTRYIQIALSLLVIGMIYIITYRISGNGYFSLLAALISAIYPPFVYANGAILTEVLCLFFLVAYVLCQLYAFQNGSVWWMLGAGLLLGLTVIVRPEFAPILIVSFFVLWVWRRRSTPWKLLLVSAAGVVLVLAPWWIRNAVTLHQFIPLATQENPLVAGTYPNNNYEDKMVDRRNKTQMEIFKERIKVGFTQHTGKFIRWYTVGKLDFIYSKMYGGGGHKPYDKIIPGGKKLHNGIIWVGIAAIVYSLIRFRKQALFLGLIIVVMSVIRLAFVPEFRYNFTAMPFFIILDCWLINCLFNLIFYRKQTDALG